MRRSTRVLLACCGALAALTFIEANYYNSSFDAPLPIHEETSIPSFTDAQSGDLSFDPPPISEFREITERPLFSPTRRPAPINTRLPLDVYRLRGVMLSQRHNIALVERRSDGKLIRLSEGDLVDEWEVASIDSNIIEFRDSGRVYKITIADKIEEPHNVNVLEAGFDEKSQEENTEKQLYEESAQEEIHEDDIEVREVNLGEASNENVGLGSGRQLW